MKVERPSRYLVIHRDGGPFKKGDYVARGCYTRIVAALIAQGVEIPLAYAISGYPSYYGGKVTNV